MQSLILTLHIIVCILLVILILLQAGKEGMGVIFGGGNTSVFGASGAGSLLTKLTAFMAVLFVITSLSYNIMTSTKKDDESSILNIQLEKAPKSTETKPQQGAMPSTDTTPKADSKASTPEADAKAVAPKADPKVSPKAEPEVAVPKEAKK